MSPSRKRILIIEDDEDLRALVEGVLGDQGYEVVSVGDGGAGVEIVHANPPDLVLLDLMLPGLDGWNVLDHVRDLGRPLPVMVMSVQIDYETHERAAREGVSAYLEKPFSMTDLVTACRQVLSGLSVSALPRERRDARRYALRFPAEVVVDEGRWRTMAEIVDVSTSGVRVSVSIPLPRREGVRLALEPPDGSNVFVLQGQVRWRSPASRGFDYGLSFVNVAPEDLGRLVRLVTASSPSC